MGRFKVGVKEVAEEGGEGGALGDTEVLAIVFFANLF